MNNIKVVVVFLLSMFVGNICAQGYLQIGADPVNVTRGLEPGRMWVKYHEELVVKTNSGSGIWYFGKIRSGQILDISIDDYNNDMIQDFLIAFCGNETYVPEGGTANTLPRKRKLDKNKIQVIVTYEQLQKQGGCITQEQYDQLRSDHEFIVSLLGEMDVIVNETNKRTKTIQELIIEMRDRMSGYQGKGSDTDDDDSGAGFWNTTKWVGIAAIIAWLTYEVIKLLSNDDGGGERIPVGGPAPDPWN